MDESGTASNLISAQESRSLGGVNPGAQGLSNCTHQGPEERGVLCLRTCEFLKLFPRNFCPTGVFLLLQKVPILKRLNTNFSLWGERAIQAYPETDLMGGSKEEWAPSRPDTRGAERVGLSEALPLHLPVPGMRLREGGKGNEKQTR